MRVRPSGGGRRGAVWGNGREDDNNIIVVNAQIIDTARLSFNIISS